MFEVVVFFLIVVFLGAGISLLRLPTTHRLRLLPLAVALFLGFFVVLTVALYPFARFDWRLLFTLTGASSLFSHFVLRSCKNRLPRFPVPSSMILAILGLAIVLNADTAVIFQKQGWKGIKQETYFRPPMHNDVERHVVVNNALLRHSGSPMLAGSPFLYQLSWHHLSAVFTGLFPEPLTRYYQVGGMVWATGVLFTWILLISLVWLLPKSFPVSGYLLLSGLLFFHTDIFHFLVATVQKGHPAIEADWSFGDTLYLRSFSLKLIALTAPQHALFFVFLTFFLGFQHARLEVPSKLKRRLSGLFFFFAFMVSPLMAAFFFIPYGIYRALLKWEWKWIPIGEFIAAYGLYRMLFGFWPHELAMRPGTSSVTYLLFDPEFILQLPLIAVVAAGVPGILTTYFLIKRPKSKIGGSKIGFVVGPLLIGALLFQVLATDNEIRRHFAMIVSFGVAWFLAIEGKRIFAIKPLGIFSLAVSAILLQGYFVYCYTGKPSVVDPSLNWADYLKMNDYIETHFPKIPVIAVSDPKGMGIEKPLAMEATTAFSMPPHAVIHSRVNADQFSLLQKMLASGDVAPYARQLGYRAIVWGPAEKKLWGDRVAKRFLCAENKLGETGEVSLYWLCDSLRAALDNEPKKDSADFYFKAAEKFNAEGWPQEALGYYFQAVKLGPGHSAAREGLAKLLERYERKDEARHWRQTAP